MRNLKRALSLGLTAAMISGLMVMGSSAASYADVTSENNVEAIEVLEAVGIMIGDENGNFNPDQNVTRNEMAVVMSNLMAYNVASYRDTSPFTDVPSWAEPYVAACYTNGITAGTSATTYGGSENVTTAQAALMVMKALGYFQYQQDFGDDWQLATVAQGNRIDLFTDVDSGVREAMTRNDVAQLVLNALEAGTVEATTSGSITVGGVTIANSVEYNYVTSTQEYARTIHMDRSTTDYTDAGSYIVELGEKLYQGDLTLDSAEGEPNGAKAPNLDVFGRPANTWEYQAKEIGTYADSADYVFTDKVTSKELYDVVGSTAASRNYSWTVTVDGETVPYDGVDLNDNKTDNNDDFLQYAGFDRQYRTGNGVRTNVYVDGTNRTVYVSITHYYAAEVDKVEDDYITLSNVNSYPDYENVADSNDEFETTDEFAADDVVIYSFADGEIREVYAAESLEGEISRVRNDSRDENGDYFDIDGTRYNYNATVDDDGRLVTENVGNDMVGYLDQYGYAIYIDESAITYDYAYVLSMNGDDDQFGGNDKTWYARLVLSDGTMVRAETDEDNDNLLGHIVSYTVDNNDIYSLTARDNPSNTTSGTRGTLFPNVKDAGTNDKDGLNIEQDRASIYVGNGTDVERYTANDNTVFIVAEEDSKLDNYDFTVYTGIKNVPDIKSDFDDRDGTPGYDRPDNTSDKHMMNPDADEDNSTKVAVAANEDGVAKVVYVQNADVAGTGEVIFVLADQDAKKVSDSASGNQKEIREIKAVVGGEIVTLEVKQDTDAEAILTSDVFTNNVGYDVDPNAANGKKTRIVALESITYNSDGLVTDVRLYNGLDGDGDGYKTYTQTKKASNGTVGLYDPSTSKFDSYGWYDDAIGVRFDPKAEEFKLSRVSGIRDDYNDGVVAIFDSNVINGICVIEYEGSSAADQMTVSFNSGDYTVDGSTPANIYVDEGDDVSFTLGNVSGHKITAVTIDNVAQTLTGNAPYTFTLNDVTDDVVVNVTTEVDNSATLKYDVDAQDAYITIDGKPYNGEGELSGYEAGDLVAVAITWIGSPDANAKLVTYSGVASELIETSADNYLVKVNDNATLTVEAVETATLTLPTNVTASWEAADGIPAGEITDTTPTEVPVGAEVELAGSGLPSNGYLKAGTEYVTADATATQGDDTFTMNSDVTIAATVYNYVTVAVDEDTVTAADLGDQTLTAAVNGGAFVAQAGNSITIDFSGITTAIGSDTINALASVTGATGTSANFDTTPSEIIAGNATSLTHDDDTITVSAWNTADVSITYTLSK